MNIFTTSGRLETLPLDPNHFFCQCLPLIVVYFLLGSWSAENYSKIWFPMTWKMIFEFHMMDQPVGIQFPKSGNSRSESDFVERKVSIGMESEVSGRHTKLTKVFQNISKTSKPKKKCQNFGNFHVCDTKCWFIIPYSKVTRSSFQSEILRPNSTK